MVIICHTPVCVPFLPKMKELGACVHLQQLREANQLLPGHTAYRQSSWAGLGSSFPLPVLSCSCSPLSRVSTDLDLGRMVGQVPGLQLSGEKPGHASLVLFSWGGANGMSVASKGSGSVRPMSASGRHGLSVGMCALNGRQGMFSPHHPSSHTQIAERLWEVGNQYRLMCV